MGHSQGRSQIWHLHDLLVGRSPTTCLGCLWIQQCLLMSMAIKVLAPSSGRTRLFSINTVTLQSCPGSGKDEGIILHSSPAQWCAVDLGLSQMFWLLASRACTALSLGAADWEGTHQGCDPNQLQGCSAAYDIKLPD